MLNPSNMNGVLHFAPTPNFKCELLPIPTPELPSEYLTISYTELYGDMVTRYIFSDKVTYSYKTFYGKWSNLCDFIKDRENEFNMKVLVEAHTELVRKVSL